MAARAAAMRVKQRGGYDERSICAKHRVRRAVWGETFTHGTVRGWGWNSLALLDLCPKKGLDILRQVSKHTLPFIFRYIAIYVNILFWGCFEAKSRYLLLDNWTFPPFSDVKTPLYPAAPNSCSPSEWRTQAHFNSWKGGKVLVNNPLEGNPPIIPLWVTPAISARLLCTFCIWFAHFAFILTFTDALRMRQNPSWLTAMQIRASRRVKK